MNVFLQETRYSVRILLKSPGFTLTAVIALALGIGATISIFSLVDVVLLKPLPVFDPDRLVMLMSTWVSETGERKSFSDASPAKFEHWRAQSSVIQNVSAFSAGVMNYANSDVVEQLRSMQVSAGFFRCWGIAVIQGRTFTTDEDVPNGPRIAVISRGLWTRLFNLDAKALGETISLDGEKYVIIGIVADSLGLREFGPPADVYVPFQLDSNTQDEGDFFKVMARLKPGVTIQQANARLHASLSEYHAKHPKSVDFGGAKDSFDVVRFRDAVVGDTRPLLLILLSAVGLVLLIACANVANLLLVRATGRKREIAIRTAIGAARGRITRQLLTESVLLSLVGGALGLLLGYAGIHWLLSINTAGLPLVGPNGSAVTIDWRLAGFAVAVSLITGIVFGLFPAIEASCLDLNSILKDGAGRSGTAFRQNKVRGAIVVSETALAVILLIGSALLIRSFVALYKVDPGFATKHVITMESSLKAPKYLNSVATETVVRSGLEHIRSLPGVLAASASCCLPLVQGFYGQPFEIVGRPTDKENEPASGWSVVSPGFFEVFQIPLKRGRTLTDRDNADAPKVVVISESMAKQYWGTSDPLYDQIVIGQGMMREFNDEPPREIIGIVADVRNEKLSEDPLPMMYIPQAQLPDAENAWLAHNGVLSWVVRTRDNPHGLVSAIRERLQETTGLPVSNVMPMDEIVSLAIGKQRFNMLLMMVFGCAALLLAAIGIYGLMAYMVEQRRQEIGIRLAIGAESIQIRNMVVRQGMSLALGGILIGISVAWGISRLMESLLFGVRARDPLVFAAVPTVLCGVALLAVWFPADRASRVNPTESLRCE